MNRARQIWRVTARGQFFFPDGRVHPCALGRNGCIAADHKREGDGKTPLGNWPVRGLLFRADRNPVDRAALPARAIRPWDGWCDDADDPRYNQPVRHPDPASHERLFRTDGLYDLIVPLGFNDDPVVPGRGSAIFLHCAKPGLKPTAGCVALAKEDLIAALAAMEPGAIVSITP